MDDGAGLSGAFGRRVNAWYIWLPLCVLFVAPFGGAAGAAVHRCLHLDLLMLLGFSVSLAFFNNAQIGLSVPLVYPFLIYAGADAAAGDGRGLPRRPLRALVPELVAGGGTVFLMAFRIGLNVLNSNVIDVGYAGVIGADKLIHGMRSYGSWPPRQLVRRHVRPVHLLPLHAVSPDLRLERQLGLASRLPTRRRSSSTWWRSPVCSCSAAG